MHYQLTICYGKCFVYSVQFYASDVNSSLLTVETRDPLMRRVIGQRQELSFYDVKLANKAYCDGKSRFIWFSAKEINSAAIHMVVQGVHFTPCLRYFSV